MDKNNLLRVGTQIYLKETKPSGEDVLIKWSRENILNDFGAEEGKSVLRKMQKFVGFENLPGHVDYQEIIDGKWVNLYQPLQYKPQAGGDWGTIALYLKHIFGEQFELGLDYMQLLYVLPTHPLPIIVLVSRARETGKSTFIHLLKAIYGNNATINSNEDFRSQFNSDWAQKLLIMVDEALLNRREDSEKFKTLSVAKKYKREGKGVDRAEIDFYGKFVICSNREDDPIIIDPGEVRYWVRKIEKPSHDQTDLLDKMIAEIPSFLYFLSCRKMSTEKKSRMWFAPELYHTKALDRIICCNRGKLQLAVIDVLEAIMEQDGKHELKFRSCDLMNIINMRYPHLKVGENDIRRLLKNEWDLTPAPNKWNYQTYEVLNSTSYRTIESAGRYFTITPDFLQSLTE